MLLPIETWADETELPTEAINALGESVTCHRVGAYRAALVFAYIAWGLAVRARMLEARCPTGVPTGPWASIQDGLRSDDRWDPTVFDATQTKSPAPIFAVSDDIRHQVRYWRDRRNDAAHAKSNAIGSAAVEGMWDFMRSNLLKFAPGGSMQDLLTRLGDHFNPDLTPPGATCDHLARQIEASMTSSQYGEFFEKSRPLYERTFLKTTHRLRPIVASFFDAVLRQDSLGVRTAASQFLCKNMDIATDLLFSCPQYVYVLNSDPQAVRELWRKKLASTWAAALRIHASLLRHDMIPPAELDEAHDAVIAKCVLDIPHPDDCAVLEARGFSTRLKIHAFDGHNANVFAWGNPNATIIKWWLATHPIEPDVAKYLCTTFATQPYANQVQAQLKHLFSSDPAKAKELSDAAAKAGVSVPATLQ